MGKVYFFNKSIRFKLFAVMLMLAITPTIVFGFISYYMSAQVLKSDSIKNSQMYNQQVLKNITDSISTLQQQSYALNLSLKDILPILTKDYETNPDIQTRIRGYMSTLLLSNKNINSIIIYNLEGYPVFYISRSGGSLKLVSSKDEAWFQKVIRLNGESYLLEPHYNNISGYEGKKTSVISIARSLIDIINSPTYESRGIVVFDSSITNFSDAITTGGALPETTNVIFSSGGNVIYTNSDLPNTQISKLFSSMNKSKQSHFNIKLDDIDYLITWNKSSQLGWFCVSLVPISELYAKSSFIKQINVTLSVIIVLLCLGGSISLSIWITTPLKKLVQSFKKLQKGDFETQVEVRGHDELSAIGLAFNMMVKNIRQLIREKYEIKLLHRQAELEMLQNQINPHFLYNTLNSISAVIKRNDNENSVKMVESLSDNFRYSLNKGVYIVSIADELEHIKQYLFLQQFRFADKFSTLFDIADDTLNCPIPRLTLQPIVENAIIHGLNESDDNGKLSITSKTYGDNCFLYVSNNGSTIPPDRLEDINNTLMNIKFSPDDNSNPGNLSPRIGLYNVCARIKLLLGNAYGIKITSTPQNGTTVKITLPIELKKERDGDLIENSCC